MITALIVAAGRGVRMGSTQRKQYMTVGGRSILASALMAFDACSKITDIVLVVPEKEITFCRETVVAAAGLKRDPVLVSGGGRRQDSVYNGLDAVKDEEGAIVLIHDGVRPFVTIDMIEACIAGAKCWGACVPALEVTDTLKRVNRDGIVETTLPREHLWTVQTPQAFRLATIKKAHELARQSGWLSTDDASLVERMGGDVHLIPGEIDNIKITTPGDFKRAESVYRHCQGRDAG